MGRLADGIDFVVGVARIAIDEEIRYPAAALAYYAFVSFVPLLMLVFATVGGQLAEGLSRTAPQFLTPQVRGLVDRSITTATGRVGAVVLAVLVLAWSAANFVGDVRTVFDRIEGAGEDTLRTRLADGFVILGSLVTAILAIVATTLLFALPPSGPVVELAAFFGLWLTLAVAFVPLYVVPSEVVTSLRGALPGAITASFGWSVLHTIVHFYAINASKYAVYGVLSGVIIILTTYYLAAAVLLIGIVINAQIAAGFGGRGK